MSNDELLKRLKGTLLINDNITQFDETLKMYLLGAKDYINSILDQPADPKDNLLNLAYIFYSQYMFLNRDQPKLKSFPVSLNAILNRLKNRYRNN